MKLDDLCQKKHPCKTCPWINDPSSDCFHPQDLQRTVIADHLNDRMQTCHSDHSHICAGFLAFNAKEDLLANASIRIAIMARVINPSDIDESLPVFDTVEEMLESHTVRSLFSTKKYHA